MSTSAVPEGLEQAWHKLAGVAPAAQLVVLRGGEVAIERHQGGIGCDGAEPRTTAATRFDLASVTKVLTSVAFLRLVDGGQVDLDDRVQAVVPEFGAGRTTADDTTWRQILAHASGLPQIDPLYEDLSGMALRDQAIAVSPIADGSRPLYTDLGPILLSVAIERLTGDDFAGAVSSLVLGPAGMEAVSFRPGDVRDVAPTEYCTWRRRRVWGEVHDKNAAALGGVAGHAGLFGNARDLATLGELLRCDGGPLLSAATMAEARREQAAGHGERRGLGFALKSPAEGCTRSLGPEAFGHNGFTGTSLWIDPQDELVIVLLTNWVYWGREDRGFVEVRASLHDSITALWR